MLEPLYDRFPAVLMARRNLARTKSRTALAALGIVIGVVAISGLGLFGAAFQRAQLESLGDIGNEVIVYPNFDERPRGLTEQDVREIRRATVDGEVVPIRQQRAWVAYQDDNRSTTVYALEDPGTLYAARTGQVPDTFRDGVLVGSTLAEEYGLEVGNAIQVDGDTYRVRAVLESDDSFFGLRVDEAVIVPPEDTREAGYSQVIVKSTSSETANASAMAIREELNDRREAVQVQELGQFREQINQALAQINTFLVGIAGISLVVAGVSILNVMLMSVIERRGEIGVLRAVGFQKTDVLRIMLTEAAFLGVAGAVVGLVLSIGVGLFVNDLLLDDPLAFDVRGLGYLAAGLVFGVGASVISGLYPAWKAANERPVEALRN